MIGARGTPIGTKSRVAQGRVSGTISAAGATPRRHGTHAALGWCKLTFVTTMCYLITHPEVVVDASTPVDQWSLSPAGRARAGRLGRLPWTAHLNRVISSAERKAVETAEILGTALRLTPEVDPGLGRTIAAPQVSSRPKSRTSGRRVLRLSQHERPRLGDGGRSPATRGRGGPAAHSRPPRVNSVCRARRSGDVAVVRPAERPHQPRLRPTRSGQLVRLRPRALDRASPLGQDRLRSRTRGIRGSPYRCRGWLTTVVASPPPYGRRWR